MKSSCVKKFFWVTLVSVLLPGCFETKSQEEVHDVQWFLDHTPQRRETLKRCANNPGELGQTPNCQNAMAAARKLSVGKLRRFSRKDLEEMKSKYNKNYNKGDKK